jgi:hypothetical protein
LFYLIKSHRDRFLNFRQKFVTFFKHFFWELKLGCLHETLIRHHLLSFLFLYHLLWLLLSGCI